MILRTSLQVYRPIWSDLSCAIAEATEYRGKANENLLIQQTHNREYQEYTIKRESECLDVEHPSYVYNVDVEKQKSYLDKVIEEVKQFNCLLFVWWLVTFPY